MGSCLKSEAKEPHHTNQMPPNKQAQFAQASEQDLTILKLKKVRDDLNQKRKALERNSDKTQ